MIKFSVLMSVYKYEKAEYLDIALNSIINQLMIPSEIIIVKDGFLTVELDTCLEEFRRKYPDIVKILVFTENRGLGLSLRDGVLACSNEYIARMDSDDIALPSRFEKQIGYLEKHEEIALLGSWITEFSCDSKNPDTITELPCAYQDIVKYAKRRNPFRHMTVVFKKSAVLDSENYRDFLWFEDYDLWVRLIQKGYKVANIPEVLVNVRADDEMFARRGGYQYLKQDIAFQKFLLKIDFIDLIDFIVNVLTRSFVRLLPNYLRTFLYRNKLRRKW